MQRQVALSFVVIAAASVVIVAAGTSPRESPDSRACHRAKDVAPAPEVTNVVVSSVFAAVTACCHCA
jgi:hypothetical protein